MSNIASQLPQTGVSSRQNSLTDFHTSSYVKEQSVTSRESIDTGLVLQTKEGDQVTLSSNSFSQMNAFTYNSHGLVQSESGNVLFSQSHSEITLASGQSFSFSVAGDLSEEELEDIASLLKGLDKVIAEMTQGDMGGAMNKALEIGGFDSVSSFAADIRYQRSYEIKSTVAATNTQVLPADEEASSPKNLAAPAVDLPPANANSQNQKKEASFDFNHFFTKLLKQLEEHTEEQVALAKNPINKLLTHHLDEIEKDEEKAGSIHKALETAMEKIDSLMEKMAEKREEEPLTAVEEH